MEKISLEQALELFNLPRHLGTTEENEEIVINIGRFGPYVRFGKRFVSLPKEEDPLSITKSRALELIEEKKEADRQKYIKEIQYGDDTLQVLNGRFGPYITNGTINASIPKTIVPDDVTLEQALELLEKAKARKARRGGKSPAADKAAKKTGAGSKRASTGKTRSKPKKE